MLYTSPYRSVLEIFFFQAEDGIRDIGVTGVQTCALPISGWPPREEQVGHRTLDGPEQPTEVRPLFRREVSLDDPRGVFVHREIARLPPVESVRIRTCRERSEERRVGKEWRARCSPAR